MNTPVLSETACPKCGLKPCLRLDVGSIAVLVSPGSIPYDCPLIVSQTDQLARLKGEINRIPMRTALSALSAAGIHTEGKNIRYDAATFDALSYFLAARKILVLWAPYGGEAYQAISQWQISRMRAWAQAVQKEAEQKAEERAKEEEVIPALKDPVWIGSPEPGKESQPEEEIESAGVNQYVLCKVDTVDLMPGDTVTFTVYRADNDEKITTMGGQVGQKRRDNCAVGKWLVGEKFQSEIQAGKNPEVYFIARQFHKKLELKGPNLKLSPSNSIPVQIQFSFIDPEGKLRTLPKDLPMQVEFKDGHKEDIKLGEKGQLSLTVKRTDESFSLFFSVENKPFVACAPSGFKEEPKVLLIAAGKIEEYCSKGWMVFRIPNQLDSNDKWDLSDPWWKIEGTSAYDKISHKFQNLKEPSLICIGNEKSPVKSTLDPHWQFLEFIYNDRVRNEIMRVPSGLNVKAIGDGDLDLQVRATYYETAYVIAIPKRKGNTGMHLEFLTQDAFVFTDAPDKEPILIQKSAAEYQALAFPEQMKYYDLPALWSSTNYWTRYDGDLSTGDRFERVINHHKHISPYGDDKTTKNKPLAFSLDDIVLVGVDGSQDIKDKDELDNPIALSVDSRVSLFHVEGRDLLLWKPENVEAPYFSDVPFTDNLITDTQGNARAICFSNHFYYIYDKRSAQAGMPYDPTKHVRGCRAALRRDPDCHHDGWIKDGDHGHRRWQTPGTGNFELHYIHNGSLLENDPSGLKIRSFLLIYWNGRFIADPLNPASNADIRNFETLGLMNSKKRWEDKGYTIEPLTESASNIQIKPVFFFEAKKAHTGGAHKCSVKISTSDADSGWMAISSSCMFQDDYKIRDYLGVGAFADIDGKSYETLVVAHELGHALGKDDDYAYHGKFKQYYLGMPYQSDIGSMMKDNRAPRMRHHAFFLNWINDESRDNGSFQKLLKPGATANTPQFKLVHRFNGRTLNYHLTGALPGQKDYRDIYKPYKELLGYNLKTGTADLGLYKLGEDETACSIKIGNTAPAFSFDGILALYFKIGFKFKNGSAGAWANVEKRKWMGELKKRLALLNNRFYLDGSVGHDFRRTYIFLFPVTVEADVSNTAADAGYYIEITLDDSSTIIQKSGKNLQIGSDVSANWVAQYIMGKDDGSIKTFFKRVLGMDKLGKSDLKFTETVAQTQLADPSFMLKGE